jgi:hypothetical protein
VPAAARRTTMIIQYFNNNTSWRGIKKIRGATSTVHVCRVKSRGPSTALVNCGEVSPRKNARGCAQGKLDVAQSRQQSRKKGVTACARAHTQNEEAKEK